MSVAALPSVPVTAQDDTTTVQIAPAAQGGGGEAKLTEEAGMDAKCVQYAPPDPGFWEKGNISNMVTFAVMIAGLAMRFGMDQDWEDNIAGRYLLAFGLFGFAGGVTNWLAVKMLFDEIPGVYGSGIIPKQFKQIRSTIKRMIIDTFFDPEFLKEQLTSKLLPFATPEVIAERLNQALDSDMFKTLLDEKLAAMKSSPMGQMLSMMQLDAAKVKPFLRPLVATVSRTLAPLIQDFASGAPVGEGGQSPIMKLRDEVDKLMEVRLQELTAERVKNLVEAVMRAHLGWLVVWGNVFGGAIGIASEAAGY
mmetsp:Transcript_25627/g.84371  ORF Transcript_25627/g.84371 Transcript_25627/m.84371 type:complete len:307 (-) Transcript_25627:141-1061(-)|eukprot:CAMPEP_0170149838 /NCGR_PEP_ID=MMETSP0033_2-20121228/44339_1 /TAXON_ID=195969 /ORGANISM="Dolichomastix tenuilepis, Strain CCMP3274" /LENGTH=306 /DNA_ID=CAMNT_0010386827 /DNA_START=36 /DNA_END=956 /DNA_ORIENTATION=+